MPAPNKRKTTKHQNRVHLFLNPDTLRILDSLVNQTPEIENRSAAVRFLCRWYEQTSRVESERA